MKYDPHIEIHLHTCIFLVAVQEVYIHRSRLKEDLVKTFMVGDPHCLAGMKVIDERGKVEEGDGEGVTRDIIATFWQQFFSAAAIGDKEKVPAIRHDYQKSEWEAIGRILLYGFKRAGYFPIALSKAFVVSCIFGEECIDAKYLLSSFRLYITEDEREVFDKIQDGEFPEGEELIDFLGNYKTYKKPSEENVKQIIFELAHQELIQKPKYIAQCWSPIVQELRELQPFGNPQTIDGLYAMKTPTTRKVLKVITCQPTDEAERQCLDHLQRFIRSLDLPALGTFLKYVTGSDLMPDNITISFTSMDGFARRPIAHTCGPLLELPRTYLFYNELAEEFTSLLREKGAWGFNIV